MVVLHVQIDFFDNCRCKDIEFMRMDKCDESADKREYDAFGSRYLR